MNSPHTDVCEAFQTLAHGISKLPPSRLKELAAEHTFSAASLVAHALGLDDPAYLKPLAKVVCGETYDMRPRHMAYIPGHSVRAAFDVLTSQYPTGEEGLLQGTLSQRSSQRFIDEVTLARRCYSSAEQMNGRRAHGGLA